MIKVDSSAAEKSFIIFKKINEGFPVPPELIREYYRTPGMVFLRKHLKHYGGFEFSEDFLLHIGRSEGYGVFIQ